MFNKVILPALVSATIFSSAVEARPLCGFWKTTTVYDYERVETEMDYTTCSYSGSTQIWASAGLGNYKWFTVQQPGFDQLENHVTCPSSETVSVNEHRTVYENGEWLTYWLTGSLTMYLTSQQHKTDIQVTYVRIEGSGREEQVWFPGTNDGEPECGTGGGGIGEF
ncbi:hypothetical protein [Thalassomonas sp. RHCl1]|uniref:hypothetical protein n=1 Tax=Thalassomonas sp. RHCl1 TaxID=2995320 RepID=UPI00248B1212|nr:hypothetical protein [Thalassomonas sp. RHCl1]